MRQFFATASVTAFVAVCVCSLPVSAQSQFLKTQETKRKQSETLSKSYAQELDKRRNKGLADIDKFLEWCADNGCAGNAADIQKTAAAAYPSHAVSDKIKTAFATPPAPSADKKILKTFDSKLDAALSSYADELLGLADKCNSVMMFDKSYDLYQEILKVNPDDKDAQKRLGRVSVMNPDTNKKEWVRETDSAHLKAREVWVDGVGWIPKADADRYRKGEYKEGGKWMSMDEANKLHADLDTMWIIDGPHFTVHSSMDRASALTIAVALEDFYRLVYKDYIGFFIGDASAKDLLFESAPLAKPMQIYFFATKDQYEKFMRKTMPPKVNINQVLTSQGFYAPFTGEAYFWKQEKIEYNLRIAFHEAVHQILGEFLKGDKAHTWIKEMLAVYMEYVKWENSAITTPPWAYSNWNRAIVLDKQFMTVAQLSGLSDADFNSGGGRRLNYAAAGGIADFLMNGDNGVYRMGFMEFCRDNYKNGNTQPLNEYLGLELPDLEAKWKALHAATYVGIEAKIREQMAGKPGGLDTVEP